MTKKFPFYQQYDAMDCGAACLRMVARHSGRFYSMEYLRELTHVDREGVSLLGISDAAENIGFHTLAAKLNYERLVEDIPLPAIAHWEEDHFVVVYKANKKNVWIADPAREKIKITKEEFLEGWLSEEQEGEPVGVLMMLETTPEFYEQEGVKQNKSGFGYLYSYIRKYKKLLFQLFLGLTLGGLLQGIFPFLMQALVDVGVTNQDINFIYLILIAQFILFIGRISVDTIRNWILMHIGIRVNISLVSDFLIKLMKLPLRFFDSKLTGDLLQRIYDNERVERFLTAHTLEALFSISSFFVFGIVLAYYYIPIFLIYIFATALYFIWMLYFLRKRRKLDYIRFAQATENQNALLQMIEGMQEIKLNNAEKFTRWAWERVQAKLYRISRQFLEVEQRQRTGAAFINESKNILITVIAAKAVIDNEMTLGMLVAVQYIIAQLNSPIEQVVSFIQSAQEAKLSLERMNEIHSREEEEVPGSRINFLSENGDISIEDLSFQYSGPHSPFVLDGVDLLIPKGKTTAIVGTSGSGKTTLLKLLLNIYQPTEGNIRLGDMPIQNIQNRIWREKSGAVLQDSYVFSDTIAKNIAIGEEVIDKRKLLNAVKIANIQSFIDALPLGYNTKIGQDGVGLSQGQLQRLLIARIVYKNPDYIFLDEATNALDSYNEMMVLENLGDFFENKTVVVVAHRLNTVVHADNIVVLEQGEVVEQGTHEELMKMKEHYYHLIKNILLDI